MSTISLMVSGIRETAIGAFQFTNGSIQSSLQSMFLGLTATNIGGRLHGLDPKTHGEIMRSALVAATGNMGISGTIQLTKGIKQKSLSEIIRGAVTTSAGVAGSVLAYSLDSRIIVAAHQAFILGVASSFLGALGIKDLVKGHYRSGACKMTLGIAGVAITICYVYKSCFQATATFNSETDLSFFIESHKGQIEEMYELQKEVGNWKKLGQGISKTAFTHTDFPEWVIKIPNARYPENVRTHHENLENLRGIASRFDRISLPKSYLYPTVKGSVLVEEMFKLKPYPYEGTRDQEKALKQFNDFVETVGLCDVYPKGPHNAGILANTKPTKIGIIDFDCRRDP